MLSLSLTIICSCADATRELLKKGDYLQLAASSSDGKPIHKVFPKENDDKMRKQMQEWTKDF